MDMNPPQASSKNDITKVCKKVTEVRLQMFSVSFKKKERKKCRWSRLVDCQQGGG